MVGPLAALGFEFVRKKTAHAREINAEKSLQRDPFFLCGWWGIKKDLSIEAPSDAIPTAFNQDLSIEAPSDAIPTAFNQDLSNWDVSNVANTTDMFLGATAMDTANSPVPLAPPALVPPALVE